MKNKRLKLIYAGSIETEDVAWKTCWKRWMIETDSERELGKSVQAIRYNDENKLKILVLVWSDGSRLKSYYFLMYLVYSGLTGKAVFFPQKANLIYTVEAAILSQ